eukprot:771668-Pleurochrysis_carterae.AAC.1
MLALLYFERSFIVILRGDVSSFNVEFLTRRKDPRFITARDRGKVRKLRFSDELPSWQQPPPPPPPPTATARA